MANQDAILDDIKVPALTAHTGTAGTAETQRLVADTSGALMVNIGGTEPMTLVAGTVSEVTNIAGGTLDNVTVTSIPQVSIGTIPTVSLSDYGTVVDINSLPDPLGSVVVTVGTISAMPQISVGTLPTVDLSDYGTVVDVNSFPDPLGSVVVTAGTVTTALSDIPGGTIDLISNLAGGTIGDATISSLPDPLGSVVVTAGTVITSLALDTGTITTIAAGTQNTLGTVGTILGVGGTVNVTGISSGTVVEVNEGTLSDVTITALPDPLGSVVVTVGTVSAIGADLPGGTIDLVTGVGTLGSISNIAVIHNAGTIASLPDLPGGTIDLGTVVHNISAIGDGVTAVGTAGEAVALAASTACKKVVIQASPANTGYIAVGGTGVVAGTSTSSRGVQLTAGDIFVMQIGNLSNIYIDSTINGEHVMYTYFN